MEYLLKIVEGPMKGAEIALVEGVAVSFGSGDDCDIIVHDATVPAKACEFEVDATGVRIAVGAGSAEPLPSFEVRSFGTTSLAVGPADGDWADLIKPVRPAMERADPEEKGEPKVAEPPVNPNPLGASPSDAAGASRPRHTVLVAAIVVLLLLAAVAVVAWLFRPQIEAWCRLHLTKQPAASAQVAAPTLDDIASTHGLVLTNRQLPTASYRLLSGNLKRRTERLAIRALALAADPSVKFDLTDDETLLAAASELMFACSDGALKVDAATNRVVTLSGYAPSRGALEKAIRALNADVKGVERLDSSRVRVGGTAPAALATTPFVREQPPGEHPGVTIPAHTPNPPSPKSEQRDYPIAGILTAPYPCVVMRNGLRLVEGAQVGKAVLVKIEADKLTLNDGGQTVEWRP